MTEQSQSYEDFRAKQSASYRKIGWFLVISVLVYGVFFYKATGKK